MPLFYELLQVAVGSRGTLSHIPTSSEWSDVYAVYQKQSLVGIALRTLMIWLNLWNRLNQGIMRLKNVEDNYTWQKTCDKYLQFVKSL